MLTQVVNLIVTQVFTGWILIDHSGGQSVVTLLLLSGQSVVTQWLLSGIQWQLSGYSVVP